MNSLLIPLIIVTVSHILIAYLCTKYQGQTHKLRVANIGLRRRLQELEEELRFFSQKLTK